MKKIEWDFATLNKIRDMILKGMKPSAIAERLGTTKNSIIGGCYRNKISLKAHSVETVKPDGRKRLARPAIYKSRTSVPLPKETVLHSVHMRFPPEHGQCRYIIGDPKDLRCCGLKAEGVYCPSHMDACFVKPVKK